MEVLRYLSYKWYTGHLKTAYFVTETRMVTDFKISFKMVEPEASSF